MRRRDLITALGGAAVVWPLAARAQQSRVPRIGVLALTNRDQEAFGTELREGLRELGFVDGRNFLLESRSADGETGRLPALADELVLLKVDVIAAIFTPCALAAKQATTSIPIVMISVGDPLGADLVMSLARPGGNITGLSNMAAETAGKSVVRPWRESGRMQSSFKESFFPGRSPIWRSSTACRPRRSCGHSWLQGA
jgi:putative ABC transport system substrate-binding protein